VNSLASTVPAERPARGWTVVAAGAVAMMCSAAGIWAPTLGIFLSPLQHELGWSQTQIYLGITLAYLLAQLAAPAVGWIVDRGQVRRLMLGALLVQVLAFACFSRIGRDLVPYYALCIVTALATLGVSAIPLVRIVNGWFTAHRGLALGVLFAASTVGPVLHPLLAQRLIDSLGWRQAYLVFAAVTLVLGFGATALWVRENDQPPGGTSAGNSSGGRAGWNELSAALAQRDFWVIGLWLVLYAYSYGGLNLHLVPLLKEAGISATRAAYAQSLLGIGSMCGNLLAAALLDRIHARRLATLFAAVPMAGIALLSNFPGTGSAYIMAMALGLAAGSEASVLMYMLGRYFPQAVLGRVVSIQFIALATGAAIGPSAAALLHDRYGGYPMLLLINAAAFAVAACAPLLLRKYRY
jgi:MFS family permease